MVIKWKCDYCSDAMYYTDFCIAEIQEGYEPTVCVLATMQSDYAKAKWERIPKSNEENSNSAEEAPPCGEHNKQMLQLLRKIHNSLLGMKWQYAGKSTDNILDEVGEFLEKIAQQ